MFTGARTDMAEIYEALDLLVLPSRQEGFGRVIVEAMAMEKPVVASDAEGIHEVINHGVSGFIVPVDDVNSLADAVISVLNDPKLAAKLGKQGRETGIERFSIESHVKNMETIYEELLN